MEERETSALLEPEEKLLRRVLVLKGRTTTYHEEHQKQLAQRLRSRKEEKENAF